MTARETGRGEFMAIQLGNNEYMLRGQYYSHVPGPLRMGEVFII